MISSLKTYIKYLVFRVLDGTVAPESTTEGKRILLMRMDAIGDYVLFRNFLKLLVNSEKYRGYKITLVGNAAWKTIAEELDSELVSAFIWVNSKKFGKNPFYRRRVLKRITSTSYDVVINPVYSREFLTQDMIVGKVTADEKIGSTGDRANLFGWQTKIADENYTRLISVNSQSVFEFDRNRAFFEKLLGQPITLKKPNIAVKAEWIKTQLSTPNALLFIGASKPFKKWPAERFAKLANALQSHYGLEIVVCGGPGDLAEAAVFKQHFKGNYIDLVGKTTLLELMGAIQKADLLVSNETSAPHFGVALDVPNIFVLSNGNHFGRFTPYPKSVAENYHAVFPHGVKDALNNFDLHNSPRGFESNFSIAEISVESVLEKINKRYVKATI